jgi:hypothetical protein
VQRIALDIFKLSPYQKPRIIDSLPAMVLVKRRGLETDSLPGPGRHRVGSYLLLPDFPPCRLFRFKPADRTEFVLPFSLENNHKNRKEVVPLRAEAAQKRRGEIDQSRAQHGSSGLAGHIAHASVSSIRSHAAPLFPATRISTAPLLDPGATDSSQHPSLLSIPPVQSS